MPRFLRNIAPAFLVGTAALVVVGSADNGLATAIGAVEPGHDALDGVATATEDQGWDVLGRLFDDEGDDYDYDDDDYDDDEDHGGEASKYGGVDGSAGMSSQGSSGGAASGASPGSSSAECSADEIEGPVVRTEWGPVQVAARVSNGQVCGIRTVTTPDGDRKSVMINARAVPVLEQQVLARGDASFQGVSGATVTSDGYRDSLQALLDGVGVSR